MTVRRVDFRQSKRSNRPRSNCPVCGVKRRLSKSKMHGGVCIECAAARKAPAPVTLEAERQALVDEARASFYRRNPQLVPGTLGLPRWDNYGPGNPLALRRAS